jgi:hypothetical protein
MNSSVKFGSDSHEITFALAEQDAWALIKALDNAFPGIPGHPAPGWMKAIRAVLKWSIITLPSWLLCAILLLMSFTDDRIRMWHVLLVVIVSIIVGGVAAFMVPQRKMHPFVRSFMGFQRQRTIVLSRDGVRTSADGSSSFIPWGVYLGVELSNGFVLMYRGRVADFIPVSVFANEDQADEIARFVAAHIKEVHSQRDA